MNEFFLPIILKMNPNIHLTLTNQDYTVMISGIPLEFDSEEKIVEDLSKKSNTLFTI